MTLVINLWCISGPATLGVYLCLTEFISHTSIPVCVQSHTGDTCVNLSSHNSVHRTVVREDADLTCDFRGLLQADCIWPY